MSEEPQGRFIEATALSEALAMAADMISKLGDGRSGGNSDDVLAYIRECNADPARRQQIQQFLILCSCGVVSMAQQVIDCQPEMKATGKVMIPAVLAGKVFDPPQPTPTSKKKHQYFIKHGDEMTPFSNMTEMSLDIACRDLAKLCDHVKGPLKMGTWIKQMESVEREAATWSHMERTQFRNVVKVMLTALGAAANLTQEVSSLVMKDTFGRLLTME